MSAQLLSYYKGKKVLVTGHTGFKGAWLLACLHEAGAITKGYALAPDYENGLFDIVVPHIHAESVIADIRDRERLKKEILAFNPDFIFHLAAQPLVRRSYEIPAETFDINVTGTANLLESFSQIPGKSTLVAITTDKVYENREEDVLYNELDRLGGYDPYSASKACAELVVSSFRNSFFNHKNYKSHQKSVATARAGNVIGGGDWSKDRIIPDIIRSLISGKEIEVRNPSAVRPWQHVLEPVSGYLTLGMLLDKDPVMYARPYNFGPVPADHLKVSELVELAVEAWGNGKWRNMSSGDQPHEAGLLKLDISQAVKDLKWKPVLTAADAIRWTMEWYRTPNEKQADITFNQIKRFFA